MAPSHLYDDFGGRKPRQPQGGGKRLSDTQIEDLKLAAFEQGFAAGWEDAVKAHAKGKSQSSEGVLEVLRDATFTMHEARRGLIEALSPLFAELSSALLPAMARGGLALHVSEQLKQMTAANLDGPITLEVSAEAADLVEDIVSQETDLNVAVTPVDAGSIMTARLRVGGAERDVDMSGLVKDIEEALTAAVHEMKQETRHG
ncbi:MAG: hypothetical protein AAFR60_05580 [Pseudomonadota bacterium]